MNARPTDCRKTRPRWAARRDLGNVTLLREDARTLWSWMLLEQLAQDVRYGLRTMVKNRLFTALAALSLALGIGANTAIYSFMDAILLRSLPVSDPASLVVVKWRSRPINLRGRATSSSCTPWTAAPTTTATASQRRSSRSRRSSACRRPRRRSCPASSRYNTAGNMNVMVKGEAELAQGEYVSGDFFRGLAVSPGGGPPDCCRRRSRRRRAGRGPEPGLQPAALRRRRQRRRPADPDQQRAVHRRRRGAVGVLRRRSGAPRRTCISRCTPVCCFDRGAATRRIIDQNYYWVEMMGRLRPGVALAQAQAALAGRSRSGWPRPRPTMASAPIFPCCASRRARRARQPQAAVLEAALRAAGDGGPDSGDRVREHGESAARAGRRAPARDGGAAQPGRRALARRPSAADGERPAGVAQRRARHLHRRGRHACADAAAGQRTGGIHAARRTELARAARHAGAVAAVRRAVRPGARAAGDAPGVDADAQGPVGQRAARRDCAPGFRV